MTAEQDLAPGATTTVVSGVPVVHWNPVRGGAPVANFGDLLGPELVGRIVAGRDLPFFGQPSRTLTSVGSILHLAPEGSVIWGTGVNGKVLPARGSLSRSLDVRSVRGPWTRRYLRHLGHDVPEVYGDPALLVPYLMPELVQAARLSRRDTLLVPNIHDTEELSAQAEVLGVPVQRPCEQVFSVLTQVATSRFVIGSSLHAVVVAESLGIPARFVQSGQEHPFKYRDYLAGTGRWTEPVARTVEEALALGPMPEPQYDAEAILDAFPYDLWSHEAGPADQAEPASKRAAVDVSIAEGIFPEGRVSDADWVEALGDGTITGSAPTEYPSSLREVVDSVAAGGPLTRLRPLVDLRRWIHTEVRLDQLEEDLRDADRAVASGSAERFVDASRRAVDGLTARAYGVFRRPRFSVLSVAVRVVDSGRAIQAVRLVNGNDAVDVRGLLLPIGSAQLDLDVIVPSTWGNLSESPLSIDVVFADGATETAVLTWVDEVPRLGAAREKSMIAVGHKGA